MGMPRRQSPVSSSDRVARRSRSTARFARGGSRRWLWAAAVALAVALGAGAGSVGAVRVRDEIDRRQRVSVQRAAPAGSWRRCRCHGRRRQCVEGGGESGWQERLRREQQLRRHHLPVHHGPRRGPLPKEPGQGGRPHQPERGGGKPGRQERLCHLSRQREQPRRRLAIRRRPWRRALAQEPCHRGLGWPWPDRRGGEPGRQERLRNQLRQLQRCPVQRRRGREALAEDPGHGGRWPHPGRGRGEPERPERLRHQLLQQQPSPSTASAPAGRCRRRARPRWAPGMARKRWR